MQLRLSGLLEWHHLLQELTLYEVGVLVGWMPRHLYRFYLGSDWPFRLMDLDHVVHCYLAIDVRSAFLDVVSNEVELDLI